jgi:hypothetical protein
MISSTCLVQESTRTTSSPHTKYLTGQVPSTTMISGANRRARRCQAGRHRPRLKLCSFRFAAPKVYGRRNRSSPWRLAGTGGGCSCLPCLRLQPCLRRSFHSCPRLRPCHYSAHSCLRLRPCLRGPSICRRFSLHAHAMKERPAPEPSDSPSFACFGEPGSPPVATEPPGPPVSDPACPGLPSLGSGADWPADGDPPDVIPPFGC